MRRALADGYELDDDPDRIDVPAVHAYLSRESYWAKGRTEEQVRRLVLEATRVLGLYHRGRQVGFCRAVSDRLTVAYLADVYVLTEHRGGGRGMELVGEMVDGSDFGSVKWLLHTADAHGLYERFGFATPGPRTMERPSPRQNSSSTSTAR